jgi:hypothetical protein
MRWDGRPLIEVVEVPSFSAPRVGFGLPETIGVAALSPSECLWITWEHGRTLLLVSFRLDA